MARAGLLLDRDGVVNEDIGYLHRVEDCRFIDGVFDMVRAFADRGFAVAIGANRSGIGRGLFRGEASGHLMPRTRGECAAVSRASTADASWRRLDGATLSIARLAGARGSDGTIDALFGHMSGWAAFGRPLLELVADRQGGSTDYVPVDLPYVSTRT